ncbi:MAG: 1-deoxy-D-xylulose-5-phosphate synthase [Planctomycetes bacterium]|nr:1-deoxy-D-xylulose-5-phosphate synthase [Planctomycetota bacterium]
MGILLDKINSPFDLRGLSVDDLGVLAEEIRDHITHSVSVTGGHLASNLGVVDLTIALHYVFDFKRDKLLWDVGHQCYAHKILTGRRDDFAGLRQQDGLSGFPNPEESEYDIFSVGHAGTSIPTALGMALGGQQKGTDESVVALVGDASIVNGVSFEALNNLGLAKRQMLIVLNDNSMAIDVTEGAVAKFLSKVRLSHTYEDLRRRTDKILEHLPVIGKKMEGALHGFTRTLRMAITPSRLFESMNIPYFGPVDGHDIGSLIKLFKGFKDLDRPAILHVYTRKGKGFLPADDNPSKFHSTGPFDKKDGNGLMKSGNKTFTQVFGETVVELAEKDERIVAITAAMTDGTGLGGFREKFPERYYDVGIAESIGVDIAAGLAKQGLKPVVCIYSTFLQRGFDQIFQEVSLQGLGVVFCIDRSGVVGNDGPTHHGLLDIGYLRCLPNLEVIAPADAGELKAALAYATASGKAVAIRYPKDAVADADMIGDDKRPAFVSGKSVVLRDTDCDVVLAACGCIVSEALTAADKLAEEGLKVGVVNARFAKPLDAEIVSLFFAGKMIITVEDHSVACGFGSAVMEAIAAKTQQGGGEKNGKVICLGAGDEFIKAAKRSVQLDMMGISAERIAEVVRKL